MRLWHIVGWVVSLTLPYVGHALRMFVITAYLIQRVHAARMLTVVEAMEKHRNRNCKSGWMLTNEHSENKGINQML